MILLAISILPGLVLLWFFFRADRYEKEPAGLIWFTFFMGVLSIIPAVILELILESFFKSMALGGMTYIAAKSFIEAALVEELCKYAAVRARAYRHPEFNEVMDGIVYGVAAAAGFATFENIMYVLPGGMGTGMLRAFLSVPMHILCGAGMGFFLGLAKFDENNRDRLIFTGLFLAVLVHGFYDFCLFTENAALALLVIPLVFLAWKVVGRMVMRSLELSPFKQAPGLNAAAQPMAARHIKSSDTQPHELAAYSIDRLPAWAAPRQPKPAHFGGAIRRISGFLVLVFAGVMLLGAIGLYSDNPKEFLSDIGVYLFIILVPLLLGLFLAFGGRRKS